MSISSLEKLQNQAKKLPNSPGVYLFKKGRRVLYVGKAGSLKSRVRSYFSNKSEKTQSLLAEATVIGHEKTDTVLEALVLEAILIKKYWPPYNVKEKDDRSFIYIVIPSLKTNDFPFPFLIRGRELEKYPAPSFNIFGPFQSYAVAKKALDLIRKVFPYCTRPARHREPARSGETGGPKSGKPCFHYQISLCPGACCGKISPKDYQKNIKNIILFLRGEKKRLAMELAREYPEKIQVLKSIRDTALLSQSKVGEGRFQGKFRIEGYDISHFSGQGTYGSMVVFENNFPRREKYRVFKVKDAKPNDDVGAMEEIIRRRLGHPEWAFPDLILVDGGKGQVNAASRILGEGHKAIPVLGIAKGRSRKNDELVFGFGDQRLRRIISDSKPTLQKVRNEAHRFAIKFSRKKISKSGR